MRNQRNIQKTSQQLPTILYVILPVLEIRRPVSTESWKQCEPEYTEVNLTHHSQKAQPNSSFTLNILPEQKSQWVYNLKQKQDKTTGTTGITAVTGKLLSPTFFNKFKENE